MGISGLPPGTKYTDTHIENVGHAPPRLLDKFDLLNGQPHIAETKVDSHLLLEGREMIEATPRDVGKGRPGEREIHRMIADPATSV